MTLKRSLKVIQTGTIRKLGCGFLFAFHSNYGSIMHHLRDKARYWSKIVIFSYLPLHSAPPLDLSPSEYRHHVWCGKKLEWWVYSTVKKIFEDMCNRLDSIQACDGQTDRHLATA